MSPGTRPEPEPISQSIFDRPRRRRRVTWHDRQRHIVVEFWFAIQRMVRRRSEGTEHTVYFPEPPADDLGDSGMGSGVPRRPPDSSGSASVATIEPDDAYDRSSDIR